MVTKLKIGDVTLGVVKYANYVTVGGRYQCSNCKSFRPTYAPYTIKYCPNCGARIGAPELDKLEAYLVDKGTKYEREDVLVDGLERHQIVVRTHENDEDVFWDAICQPGSYGYDEGLLEVAGIIVPGGDVIGWLKYTDVIDLIEVFERNHKPKE